jgi:hypothetical protein
MKHTERESERHNGAGEAPAASTISPDLDKILERILTKVPPILSLPKAGQKCPYTGKPRTFLAELVAPCERNGFKPPVKAIYKKSHRHAQRGVWLIPAENLFRYLLGLSEGSVQVFMDTREERTRNQGSSTASTTHERHQ